MNPEIKNNTNNNHIFEKEQYEIMLQEYRTEDYQKKVNAKLTTLGDKVKPDTKYILNKFFNNEELTSQEYRVIFKIISEINSDEIRDNEFQEKVEEELNNNYKETLKDIAKESAVSDNTLTWLQSIAETERNTNKSVELGISFYTNGEKKRVTLIVDMKKLKYELLSINDVMLELISTNPEFAKLIQNKEDKNQTEFTRIALDKYLIKSREVLNNTTTFKGVSSNDLDYKKFWNNLEDNIIFHIMNKLTDLLNPNSIDNFEFFQPS